MAGGMTPRGDHGTLEQRIAQTRANEAQQQHGTAGFHGRRPADWADAITSQPPTVTPPPIKHCWYEGPHGRQAALLLEWRNINGLFHGRIVVASLEPDGWAVVEMIVEQGLLTPA